MRVAGKHSGPGRRAARVKSVDLAGGGAGRLSGPAHGEHEKRTGQADADWPDWYAAYMVAEQAGTGFPA